MLRLVLQVAFGLVPMRFFQRIHRGFRLAGQHPPVLLRGQGAVVRQVAVVVGKHAAHPVKQEALRVGLSSRVGETVAQAQRLQHGQGDVEVGGYLLLTDGGFLLVVAVEEGGLRRGGGLEIAVAVERVGLCVVVLVVK